MTPVPPRPPEIAGHPVPPRLLESNDAGLVAWRERLPGVVDELLEGWGLRASAPFLPGGSSAWVAPVVTADGAERVLKVAWAHDESRDEAAGMSAWQGHGAAGVHRAEREGETAVLLLDRVRPGTPLAEWGTWPERDEVAAAVMRRLWVAPERLVGAEEAARFRPLAQMCSAWADGAAARAASGPTGSTEPERSDPSAGRLPDDLVEHALERFRRLPEEWDGEQVLLATDLNPGNILASAGGPDPWVLIDPKPYVGDPHYDVLQHMLNDPERMRAQPGHFADRMAHLTGLDPRRVREWLLARCVQESAWMDGAAEAALLLARDL
ncbi:aminoglycoside phosphotransferase family protein [Brachybacterium sp. J144]|uniref:aminoglycoside phosphotransferase family protein n=1 Tax=Brachybacterium sp. J144 TaxID=3116487 RepID=UPI002E7A8FEB|nr:aminoglycoside phosphotransferase family protein [Brachybacterium sp. J144]MEE1650513.1 aminoglycoside phosphotransferase family protein [Brachybacterium sp. J144]